MKHTEGCKQAEQVLLSLLLYDEGCGKLQVQASRAIAPLSGGFVHTPLWQKLAPLALIFFCATFNHTLLVNMKVRCPLQCSALSYCPQHRERCDQETKCFVGGVPGSTRHWM